MDLSLSWEQQQLKDTLAKLVAGLKPGQDWRAAWKQLAELGVLGLPIADASGGAGGSCVDAMVVLEALGRGPVPSPFLAATVLAGGLLDGAATQEQRARILPGLAAGERLPILAHTERAARYDLAHVATKATKRGSSYVLDGAKHVVPWADAADALIVSARIAGDAASREGIALFLVDPQAKGAHVRGYPTVDGHRAGDVILEGVAVGAADVLPDPGAALPAIERAIDRATAGACAEASGAMAALYELTLAYTKQRRQFGATIGAFQAVQHRLVDMFMGVETSRSMAVLASIAADRADAASRLKDIAAAKAHVARWSRFVAQQGVQLHGAIAMTDEYPAGRYFKRLTVLEKMFGDADHFRRVVAEA
ncbi:MAG: acyl-CoA dehydrogenase family protein [Alphaproteobacteria bacterium]|nr:acyl-CoA dehydrogenase family protein [Alphaproteobacteria bacterium]